MEYKTLSVENYESGQFTLSYRLSNETCLGYGETVDFLRLRTSLKIGDHDSMNAQHELEIRMLKNMTFDEMIERVTLEMAHSLASLIHKKLRIADAFKKHAKGIKAIRGD